jgi:hypothetical protein
MTTCNVAAVASRDASPSPRLWHATLTRAFLYYYGATLICLVGVSLGRERMKLCTKHPDAENMDRADALASFGAWDGVWYRRIATEGYAFSPGKLSSVAFFPGYPLAAATVSRLTGMRAEASLLLVSHGCLYLAFVLLLVYCRQRFPDAPAELHSLVLLCFGLFPTTFYFRMAYSESLFITCLLLGMYAMERDWSPVWVALIVGAATATRAVGVAMLLPFGEWMLFATDPVTRTRRRRALVSVPLALWGIGAFLAFQAGAFGDPLAFLKAQSCWQSAGAPQNWFDKVCGLTTLRPFWSVYLPLCPMYWRRFPPHDAALLNMSFLNPIFVAGTWAAIAVGAKRRWLSRRELLLSIGVLFIPYVTHADRFGMHSGARYAAAAFPFYIVLARILWQRYGNVPLICGAFACCGIGLCVYSAMFTSWYYFY